MRLPAAAYYQNDQRFSAATNADRIQTAQHGAAARQQAWTVLQAAPSGRVVQTRHGDR
jgi:hypothetical protein